jgi:signal peptidase I
MSSATHSKIQFVDLVKRKLKAHLRFILFVLFILFVRGALANQYLVPTGSMEPTIAVGDRVFVNRVAYDFKIPLTRMRLARLGEPTRGDVVVFESPEDGIILIKRLIAGPGDHVQIRSGVVWINGQEQSKPEESVASLAAPNLILYPEQAGSHVFRVQRMRDRAQWPMNSAPSIEFVVPEEAYFMMGDNRDNSHDSRAWGFVPRANLIGRAERVLFSLDFAQPTRQMVAWQRFGMKLL